MDSSSQIAPGVSLHDGGGFEPEHYVTDAEFAPVAALWELSARSFPAAVVPPPLVPMVLHAVAQEPTASTATISDPVAYARHLTRLIPGVTSRVECRAVQDLADYVAGKDRDAEQRAAFVEEAIECYVFARAARVLNATTNRPSPSRFRPAPATVQGVLGAVRDTFRWNPAAVSEFVIRDRVFEPIIEHIRRNGMPAADNRADAVHDAFEPTERADCAEHNRADGAKHDASAGDDSEWVDVIARVATSATAALRHHLRALGAIDAIARRPLSAGLLTVLSGLTSSPPKLEPRDVPETLITCLGRCLADGAPGTGQMSDAAAAVLSNVIDRGGPAERVEALFAIPGVLERLYGADLMSTRHAHHLATRCCCVSTATADRAVAAGLLRPATLAFMVYNDGRGHTYAVNGIGTLQNVVGKDPRHASEAVCNGLPDLLARALTRRRFPSVQIAAAECVEQLAQDCDDVAASKCLSSGLVAAAAPALSRTQDGELHAAVVRALTSLAARDEATFARAAAASAPGLRRTLQRLRRELVDADDDDDDADNDESSHSDDDEVDSDDEDDEDEDLAHLGDGDQETVQHLSYLIRDVLR